MYQVIDSHTGAVIRTAKTSRGAYRTADRLDAKYGAVRYTVRFVEVL